MMITMLIFQVIVLEIKKTERGFGLPAQGIKPSETAVVH